MTMMDNNRAYPRGCGGTVAEGLPSNHTPGLSPRVRGNPIELDVALGRRGPIPAGAGEPFDRDYYVLPEGAYPRGCGGTVGGKSVRCQRWGLSPRVRGNLPRLPWRKPSRGPIPAGAGEPASCHQRHAIGRAYPRGCGGTIISGDAGRLEVGLSPRVRGNRWRWSYQTGSSGPIPAGAGEPPAPSFPESPRGAYPRGCGGTSPSRRWRQSWKGLSPRVRGNRRPGPRSYRRTGPIPAGAGEPARRPRSRRSARAYPRGCGGTGELIFWMTLATGLSPRVRGNQRLQLGAKVA